MDKTIPPIVERNKDVEHIMLASAIYGVNGHGKKNIGKLFSMLAVADVHQSYKQMESAIDYLNYYDAFDIGISLGDMQAGSYSDSDGIWYRDAIHRAHKPFLTVLGNHDGGNYGEYRESGTPRRTFEKFILSDLAYLNTPSGKEALKEIGLYWFKSWKNDENRKPIYKQIEKAMKEITTSKPARL